MGLAGCVKRIEGRMMPMDRSRYPPNWDKVALKVKEAADWTCEECKRPCCKPGEGGDQFAFRLIAYARTVLEPWMIGPLIAGLETEIGNHKTRYTLTVSHSNHDPENPDAELRALCSGCHLRYDGAARKAARE